MFYLSNGFSSHCLWSTLITQSCKRLLKHVLETFILSQRLINMQLPLQDHELIDNYIVIVFPQY